ncbi:MAG: ABC transporter permease subunit [Spirochaetales bacterium]|nr:ABC transporter permease subunit [Spirochaetales bacterium]
MLRHSFSALVRREITELTRTSKGIIGISIFLFFGLQSPVIARYLPQILQMVGEGQNIKMILPEPVVMDAYNQFIKNISQICMMVLIFLSMGAVAGEKEKGTITLVLVRPVPRYQFLCSKFLVYSLFLVICLGGTALVTGFYTALMFPEFSVIPYTEVVLLLFLYMLSFLYMTIFLSTLLKTPISAGLLSLLLWLGLSLVTGLGTWGLFSPMALPGEAVPLLNNIPLAGEPFIGAGLMIFLSLAGSVVVFRNWEG